MSVPESEQLATTFATIARELEAAPGPRETRDVVTRHAVEQVPGCAYAAISLIHRGGAVSTVAATHEIAHRVDQIQYDTGEGPCLDAISDHVIYQLDDLPREEPRWPDFIPRAKAETDVGSMLAFRLFTAEDLTGSLNLYSTEPYAFNGHSRAVGTILAAHAAIALLAAGEHENADHLRTALTTSRQIGTAIGIIMKSQGLSQDQAFGFLRDVSQRLNRKLRDVADVIVEAGGIPSGLGGG